VIRAVVARVPLRAWSSWRGSVCVVHTSTGAAYDAANQWAAAKTSDLQPQILNQSLMNQNKKKVVIVDDHPLFRERLAQLINYEPDMEVAGAAENTKDAVQLVRNTSPDLATVDITLKGSSGLELIKIIKPISVGLQVLVLSLYEESLYAERALRAGASGYITKHHAADEVLSAIRRVLAGEVYLSEKITSGLLKSLNPSEVKTISGFADRLTCRELEVMDLIGRGQTSREIADTLQVGVATIDTYRAKIKEKMNLRNATELQRVAIRWVCERE
jgi:DNA-binding NarL/FixJ family response regulator